jgi:hypothetical protein
MAREFAAAGPLAKLCTVATVRLGLALFCCDAKFTDVAHSSTCRHLRLCPSGAEHELPLGYVGILSFGQTPSSGSAAIVTQSSP